MASGYTAFITYVLIPTGYTQPIHCNYINEIDLNAGDYYVQKISVSFSNTNEFRFLNANSGATTGYSANQFYALIQLVYNSGLTDVVVAPDPASWKLYDLTDQIDGYTAGQLISPADMLGVVFEIPLLNYSSFSAYTLSYLSYPITTDTSELCFGDEMYFFGNVTADIKADVYVLELPVNLLLSEFNSSTNATWNSTRDESVVISEVGIYSEVNGTKELVGIGKLNNPITKDSTISRTIVFAIDF